MVLISNLVVDFLIATFLIKFRLSLVSLVEHPHLLALVCLQHKVQVLAKHRLEQGDFLDKQDLGWVSSRLVLLKSKNSVNIHL